MTMNKLQEILSFQINNYGEEYKLFIKRYFHNLEEYQNGFFYKAVGEKPRNLYLCKYGTSFGVPGRNNIEIDGSFIYLSKKNRRSSDRDFVEMTSAYIMLELIDKKSPGLYVFMPKFIEFAAIDLFLFLKSELLDECEFSLFIGALGREYITKTDRGATGHRTASDEFAEDIARKLDLKIQLNNDEDHDHENTLYKLLLSRISEIIPENVGIPCGVEKSTFITEKQFPASAALVVDYHYLENLISKLQSLHGTEVPIARSCEERDFVWSTEDYKKHFEMSVGEQNVWTWLKALF